MKKCKEHQKQEKDGKSAYFLKDPPDGIIFHKL